MTKDSAIGYAILAMERQAFIDRQIRKVVKQMLVEMEYVAENKAEETYRNF